MSKVLKWLEAESDRLEKECNENNNTHRTVNHSFLEGFNYALLNAQNLEQLQLDDKQQIVLDWLKERISGWSTSIANVIYYLSDEYPFARETICGNAKIAYDKLSRKEQLEVLAAFAQWGLEQEEAE